MRHVDGLRDRVRLGRSRGGDCSDRHRPSPAEGPRQLFFVTFQIASKVPIHKLPSCASMMQSGLLSTSPPANFRNVDSESTSVYSEPDMGRRRTSLKL